MKGLKKYLAIGALGLASLFGCSTAPDFKKFDVGLEQWAWGDNLQTSQSRIDLKEDGKRTFSAEYTENNKVNATLKKPIELPGVFKGYVSLIGESESIKHENNQNSLGADFEVKTKDNIIIGGVLERTVNESLKNVYTGYGDKNLLTQIGIAQLNDKEIVQGMLAKAYGDKTGYILGIGGLYGDNEQITANIRKFTEKGKGFGYDIFSQIGHDGNSFSKAVVALSGSNIGKFKGITGFQGYGLNEQKLIHNPLDRLTPDLFKGDTVLVAKYFTKDGEDNTGSLALYHDLGSSGIIKDFKIGLATGFDDDVMPVVCFNVGPVGVYWESRFQKGSKPQNLGAVWFSVSDIYNALVGEKKK